MLDIQRSETKRRREAKTGWHVVDLLFFFFSALQPVLFVLLSNFFSWKEKKTLQKTRSKKLAPFQIRENNNNYHNKSSKLVDIFLDRWQLL